MVEDLHNRARNEPKRDFWRISLVIAENCSWPRTSSLVIGSFVDSEIFKILTHRGHPNRRHRGRHSVEIVSSCPKFLSQYFSINWNLKVQRSIWENVSLNQQKLAFEPYFGFLTWRPFIPPICWSTLGSIIFAMCWFNFPIWALFIFFDKSPFLKSPMPPIFFTIWANFWYCSMSSRTSRGEVPEPRETRRIRATKIVITVDNDLMHSFWALQLEERKK